MRALERLRARGGAPEHPLADVQAIDEAFMFSWRSSEFRRTKLERVDGEISVTVKNATTGIRASAAGDRVDMTIGRLGQGGRTRASDRDDRSYRWWIGQDLVATRSEGGHLAGRDDDIHRLPAEHVRALRAHEPLLGGDFGALEGQDWWNARHG
jgi:hypothetical protein